MGAGILLAMKQATLAYRDNRNGCATALLLATDAQQVTASHTPAATNGAQYDCCYPAAAASTGPLLTWVCCAARYAREEGKFPVPHHLQAAALLKLHARAGIVSTCT
jgi:hypothetical protein